MLLSPGGVIDDNTARQLELMKIGADPNNERVQGYRESVSYTHLISIQICYLVYRICILNQGQCAWCRCYTEHVINKTLEGSWNKCEG